MTIVQLANTQVQGFEQLYKQMLTNVRLNGQSESALANYARSLAKLSLHFGFIPLDLTDQQINEYLLTIRDKQNPSLSYFKHTVDGLRYCFRLAGRNDRAIELPSIKRLQQLSTVLSKQECKRQTTPTTKTHVYLHVAQTMPIKSFSPLDTLYKKQS